MDTEKLITDIDRLSNCLTNLKDALQYEKYVQKLAANTEFDIIISTDIKMLRFKLEGAFKDKLPKPN